MHFAGVTQWTYYGKQMNGIREGTVCVPNSFGPMQAMGDEFGEPRYEPANILLEDRYFDNLSRQHVYKCFACRVRKA